MRYVGKIYRPPSEANAYILQATIGCSWNKCTYCDMYRDKPVFRVRDIKETLKTWFGGTRGGARIESSSPMACSMPSHGALAYHSQRSQESLYLD